MAILLNTRTNENILSFLRNNGVCLFVPCSRVPFTACVADDLKVLIKGNKDPPKLDS